MRLLQLGDEDLLESQDIWFCLTCFDCNVDCPHGIDLAEVFKGLRELAPDEKEEEYISYCERCGRPFLTTKIRDHLLDRLREEDIDVNEDLINHCPTCRQYYNARAVALKGVKTWGWCEVRT